MSSLKVVCHMSANSSFNRHLSYCAARAHLRPRLHGLFSRTMLRLLLEASRVSRLNSFVWLSLNAAYGRGGRQGISYFVVIFLIH